MTHFENKYKSSHRRLMDLLDRRLWDEIEECLEDTHHIYLGTGKTALHWACYYHAPANTVQMILNKYPCAGSISDKIGFTPLHYSAINDDLDVIGILVSACPKSVAMLSFTSGESPMHISMLRRSYNIVNEMLRVNSEGLIKENKSGETPLDYFFKDWYFPILKMLNDDSLNNHDQKQSETSITNNILPMDYVIGNRTIQEIYDISNNLFSVFERLTVSIETEEPSFMLNSAFKNASCPWVFCEFLAKFLLPNEVELLGNDTFLLFASKDKSSCANQKTIYDKVFICNKCSKSSKELYDVSYGGNQCKNCADRYLKAQLHRKICCDEEVEKVQLLFTCLTLCPTMCAINSKKK